MISPGWRQFKLSHILNLEYGKGLSNRQRKNGTYPVVGSNGIIGYHDQSLIKGPGIIIGRKGTIGAINWIDSDFWPIDTTFYVKIKTNDVDLRWLYYSLSHLNLPKLSLSDVVPGLKRELVYSLKLVLPPLPEQKKIAEILSTVDQAIEKVDEAIGKIQRLKKALMQELLTKGIGHKEFKETEIGSVPRPWQIKKLGDISKEIYRYPTYYNIEYKEEGIKEIRGELIKENGEIESDKTKFRCISHETSEKYKRTILETGDFVITVRGTMGKIGIVSEYLAGSNITANLMRVSLDRRYCFPDFYKYVFLSRLFQRKLSLLSPQTTIRTIQAPRLKSMSIPLPSLQEQRQIAEIMGTVDKKLDCLRYKKDKLERTKKALMEDLLIGKKRVILET